MSKHIKVFLFAFFVPILTIAQCTLLSWNLCNMGKSKDDAEIRKIASIIKHVDIICLQEINTGIDGAQAVGRLVYALNRLGSKWDYAISDMTMSEGPERYAFIWKTSTISKAKDVFLERRLDTKIDREPALCRFNYKNQTILVANYHAVPKKKEPWREIKHMIWLQTWYKSERLIICGDFNTEASHQVFESFRIKNLSEALQGQKTTLKIRPKEGQHRANAYDHVWYDQDDIEILQSGVIDFSNSFETLIEARKLSDHLPIWIKLSVRK